MYVYVTAGVDRADVRVTWLDSENIVSCDLA